MTRGSELLAFTPIVTFLNPYLQQHRLHLQRVTLYSIQSVIRMKTHLVKACSPEKALSHQRESAVLIKIISSCLREHLGLLPPGVKGD